MLLSGSNICYYDGNFIRRTLFAHFLKLPLV